MNGQDRINTLEEFLRRQIPTPEQISEPGLPIDLLQKGMDYPYKLKTQAGGTLDAIVRYNPQAKEYGVFHGANQLGTTNPDTLEFTPKPPTAWEQAGRMGMQAGLKGLEWGFKPFELFGEYLAKPFAIAVTAPAWQKKWWELRTLEEQREHLERGYELGNIAAETPLEFIKAFMPKGEFRKAYEKWEAPKYVRGAIELIPWFAIPPFGAMARGLAGLGKGGQVAAYALTPYVLMEKGLGKVIEVPIKGIGKVVEKVGIVKYVLHPDPIPKDRLLEEMRFLHPERFGKRHIPFTQRLPKEFQDMLDEADIIKRADQGLKEGAVATSGSRITTIGDYEKLFNVKSVEIPGVKMPPQKLVELGKQIVAKTDDPSWVISIGDKKYAALNDILEFPSKFQFKSRHAKLWAKQLYNEYSVDEIFRQKHIGRITEAPPKNVEAYIHRLVTKHYDIETGKLLREVQPYAAGSRGGIAGSLKPARFQTTLQGIQKGYEYTDPITAKIVNTEEYYNMSTFERAMSGFETLMEAPSERMSKAVADSMRDLNNRVKILGGGFVKVTREGKEIRTSYRGLRQTISAIQRGEVPSARTISTIERNFPELGGKLREALQITSLEVDDVIKGLSADIWANVKVNPNRFRQTLLEVRQLRAIERLAEYTPGKIAQFGDELRGLQRLPDKSKEVLSRIRGIKRKLALAEEIPLLEEITAKGVVSPGELSATLKVLGVEENTAIGFLKKMYAEAYKKPQAERAAILKQLAADTKVELATAKAEAAAFTPEYKLEMQKALQTAFDEGRVIRLQGYMNRVIPDKTDWGISGYDIARKIEAKLAPEKVNVLLKGASRAVRIGVTLEAALDFSLVFIQGGLVLGHDVARWASGRPSNAFYQMTKGMVRGVYNPKYFDTMIAKEANLINEMAKNGLIIQREVEYMRPSDIQRLLKKLGTVGGFANEVFGQTYGRFGAGFGTGSAAGRIQIYKQMRDVWVKEGHSLRELAELANKMTGVISAAELGINPTMRAIESAGLFAPNYTRAYLMVLRDLFRGNQTATEVRKAMAGMFGAGVIGYVGLCELIGQEPHLNPAPKALGGDGAEFMSIKIGNSIIGVPGFWYSALRMLAGVTAAAEHEPEKLLSLNWRENPFLGFWMGRTSPVVRLGRELIEGKDFTGKRFTEPGDWAQNFAEYFMTIAAQNLTTRAPHEEEGKFKRFGAELFGLRAIPQSIWNQRNELGDTYAHKEFGKGIDTLNQEQKEQIRERYPDFKQLEEVAGKERALEYGEDWEGWLWGAKKQADAEYRGNGEQLALALFAGNIDYRTYLEAEASIRKIYQGNRKMLNLIKSYADPDLAEKIKKYRELKPLPAEDVALDKYNEIRSDLKRTPDGLPDWDGMEKRLKEFLDSLPLDTRNYVFRMRDHYIQNLPPAMRAIAKVQSLGRDKVEEYYKQPEGRMRLRYRLLHPEVDAWLLLMGRVSKPQNWKSQQITEGLAREYGLPLTIFSWTKPPVMPVSGVQQWR